MRRVSAVDALARGVSRDPRERFSRDARAGRRTGVRANAGAARDVDADTPYIITVLQSRECPRHARDARMCEESVRFETCCCALSARRTYSNTRRGIMIRQTE